MVEADQSDTRAFRSSRLTLARKRRGLSRAALGRLVGVHSKTVARWENDDMAPDEGNVAALAEALELPESYLLMGDDLDEIPLDSISFRAGSKMTARQRDMSTAAGRIVVEIDRWIRSRFRLPLADVPTLDVSNYSPERAASAVRERWGLGSAPIQNMLDVLELHGVAVFSLAADCAHVDAFSFRFEGRPYVILNTGKTAERRRFDAAHELGHLVMHGEHQATHGKEAEAQAQAFASAFLMPASAVQAAGLRHAGVADIVRAKRIWRVAAMALTYRLRELDLLSEWGYRDNCMRLSQMGYRSGEPAGGLVPEVSQVLTKVLKALRAGNFPLQTMANELHLTPDELDLHIFGLLPHRAYTGGGQLSPPRSPTLQVLRGGRHPLAQPGLTSQP